ncbi:MAG TPA: CotH kinase family protein [Verrucomicrobiae bacterium]|nr:CotH kinase family protein [Verrucomicrobiae bacterium]
MPTRNSRPWGPWKVLIIGGIGCSVVFTLLAAAGVTWLVSTHHNHDLVQADEAQVEMPRKKKAHRTRPPIPIDIRTNENAGADRIFGSDLPSNQEKPNEAPSPSPTVTKNAVLAPKNQGSLPGDDIFKDLLIPNLQIKVPSQGVSGLSRSPRRYVRVTIEEGGNIYTNVAIRLKGGPGSFRPLQDKPAFTLNFDKFAEGQRFHGLKKIHLNNSVQDRTCMKEKISRELFEAAGVPAPRAGNALVHFNERDLGLYVLVEGINKQFLKRYFKDTKGNIYDGHSGSDVTSDMPTNDGENPRDKSRLRALARAAQESDLQIRLAELEKTLDVDRFLSFIAMEMILEHWDGYTMNRNNYRIYHDRDTDRMVFIPQGLDQVLGRRTGTIFPPAVGLVARSVLQVPELRQRYRDRVAQLATNVFRVDAVSDRIHEVAERIDAAVGQTGGGTYKSFGNALAGQVRRRATSLQSAITPANPVKFDTVALAPLTDWHPQKDKGEAELDKQEDGDGSILLHVSTESGCIASWRTTSLLEPGRYRFEGRIKTKGVVFEPGNQRAGAGFRIHGYRTGQKYSGDRDWTPIAFEFEVSQDQSEIDLVCELFAQKGDVWFDAKSLRLRRL